MAKKTTKGKSAPKAAPKKAVKKTTPKTTAKKPVAKKTPVKKAPEKKKAAKPIAKKQVVKPIAKSKVKPAPAKQEVKAKKVEKPVAVVTKPVNKSPEPKRNIPAPKTVERAKPQPTIDMDDDSAMEKERMDFKNDTYRPVIRKVNKNQPKPFIGKDSRTRYSDKELAEFKKLILEKLDEAKKDYDLLVATLSHKDDHGTDDTSPTFKLLEDGSDVLSKEETSQLAARQEKFIQNLQNALIRIENKSYGICRVTGKLIPKERLRSVPHATLAIEAKLEQTADI